MTKDDYDYAMSIGAFQPEPKPEFCHACHSEELISDADKQTGLCPDCRSSEANAYANWLARWESRTMEEAAIDRRAMRRMETVC